jgi:putative CocE/NonD family hydrolase
MPTAALTSASRWLRLLWVGTVAWAAAGSGLAQGTPAAALEARVPALACNALAETSENAPAGDTAGLTALEERFRLAFACGRLEQALHTLADWKRQRPVPPRETVEPWLRLELHARALLAAAPGQGAYGEAFATALATAFAALDDRSAVDSAWALGLPPRVARMNLDRRLEQLAKQSAEHTTITRADLLDLLYWHSTWQAVSAYAPGLDAALARDDERRFVIDRNVLIRTPQGATLSADVVRPRRLAGPQPTALRFTIYSDPVFNLKSAKEAAARGYVGVLASARGKAASPDAIVPWETEVADTWAVIDWISHQPWSDGQVGMYGNSYDGFAQWAAAKSGHPALKTIVPSGASFPGNGLPMQNSVFQLGNYGWPLQVTSDRFMGSPALQDGRRWSALLEAWFASGRPLREIDAIDGTPNEVLQRQLRHPSFDDYWQAMQPWGAEFARIRIPVLSLTGYFDDAGAAAVNYLVEHRWHRPNAPHYLVIGPWSHGDNLSAGKRSRVNGYEIDPVANIDTEALTFQWFDHVLRGGPRPALLRERINYQVMGTNTWAHAPSIPQMAAQRWRLYLSAEPQGARHRLTPHLPVTEAFVEQRVDLADRQTRHNLYPTSAWSDAPDAPTRVAYVSEPLEVAACVCGQVTGALQASVDRRDFDFTWALYEITPEGRYFNLSYYLGRASYAAHRTQRRLLTPGRKTLLPFSMTPLIAKQLAPGSRLLLLLTVNKNPYAEVNHGTGRDVSHESIADAGAPLRVRWYGGSFIEIPLQPQARAAMTARPRKQMP